MEKFWHTIRVFAYLNTKRFFRDKLAIFFTIAFPLIFLFIFGGLFSGSNNMTFRIFYVNQSKTQLSHQFSEQISQSKIFKIDITTTDIESAKEKMKRGELDAIIVLPINFGEVQPGQKLPSGKADVYYSQNDEQAGQTLSSLLEEQFGALNSQFVKIEVPFTVQAKSTKESSLTRFDYIFAGLLGFSIVGLGIFGPVNVFPELKKQGILRRYRTTPLRVSQYFVSNVISQGAIGLIAVGALTTVSLVVFDLQMRGSYFDFIIFILISIFTIYGIGLAIGGWAKNERQAAPLGNLITFPMIFLSGTFFPRFLMPEWLQSVSYYLPLTPVIDGIRLIVTEGKGLMQLGTQIILLAIWSVVIYIIAFRVFRWE